MTDDSRSIFMPAYAGPGISKRLMTGGIIYDSRVGRSFQDQGWNVEYFDLETLPRYAKMLKFPAAYLLQRISPPFDVLLTDLGNSALIMGFQDRAGRMGRLTVMICHHFRGDLERTLLRRMLYRFAEKRVVASAGMLVANSSHTSGHLVSMGREKRDIILAPPGLQVTVAKRPRVSAEPREILAVGSVEARKGTLEMIRALHASGLENAVLTLAGDMNRESEYTRSVLGLIDETGLGSRVRLAGRVSEREMKEAYCRADLFMLLSYWEGYGMAIAEAMARGLPVVSTRAGAIPGLVKEGVTGLLVDPGDWMGAAGHLRRLFGDPDLRESLAENALEAAAAFPTWEETTARIISAVQGRLKGPR